MDLEVFCTADEVKKHVQWLVYEQGHPWPARANMKIFYRGGPQVTQVTRHEVLEQGRDLTCTIAVEE